MSKKNHVSDINALFRQTYSSRLAQAIFYPPFDYEAMPIEELAWHISVYTDSEAKKVYARRTTKLWKYLEGAE
jgi:hypothetical protein